MKRPKFFRYRIEQYTSYGHCMHHYTTRFKILAILTYYIMVKCESFGAEYALYGDFYGANYPDIVLSKCLKH